MHRTGSTTPATLRFTRPVDPAWRDRFLSALVAAVDVGVVACDADGTLLLFNEELERIHGLAAEAIGPDSWADHYDVYLPDGTTPFPESEMPLVRALAGEIVGGVDCLIAPRGLPRRRVLIDAMPVHADDGRLLGALALVRDVTPQRDAELRLQHAEEQFRMAFEDAPIGMALVSLEGRFLRVNSALAEITGYSAAALTELTFQDITHPNDLDGDLELVRQLVAGDRRSYDLEKRYLRADGSVVWVHLHAAAVRDELGRPMHLVAQIQDVSERKRFESDLRRLAERDSLTGLLNRRRFDQELDGHLARSRRYGARGALLLLDVDGLKRINDTHGHAAGDELLRSVAGVLHERLRESDVIARIGGDEFAVLLPAVDAPEAERVTAELLAALRARRVKVDGHIERVHASIGVGAITEPVPDADELVRIVDGAMYVAKRSGGDAYAAAPTVASR